MKATFSAVALLVGGACSERLSDQEAIIRVIESAVELPAGAKALKDYSRNYALRPDGKVIGVYVTPAEARDSEDGCEVALIDEGSRPCTEAEQAELATHDKTMTDLLGQANQSRWLKDYRTLPVLMDGGCDVIEIIFEPRSKRIESAQCNGDV